jgi:hypothetical protein
MYTIFGSLTAAVQCGSPQFFFRLCRFLRNLNPQIPQITPIQNIASTCLMFAKWPVSLG